MDGKAKMSRRKHMPIIRFGWQAAKSALEAGKCTLLEYEDGHAELLSNATICPARGSARIDGGAMGYLTCRSLVILKSKMSNANT